MELDSKLVKRTKVAVITGYGSQKYILQTMVKQHSFKHIEVDVDTVDAFQGSQKVLFCILLLEVVETNTVLAF